jgi:hypothetical protein
MIYIKFDENNIQEQTVSTEESPGQDWHVIPSNTDGKFYKLSNGVPVPMTEKELEDYRFDLKRTWVIQDARNKRDRALIESDWTQLSTSPLSDAKKTEWETYRQALRDLPDNISEDLTYTLPEVPV